jgi:hypothetical protein
VIHSEAAYPHDHERLPTVKQLLADLDWEVVCVFDACRWDAFEEVCAPAEPAASPGSHTPTWTLDLWCDSDYDWSDVTYVSANPMTTHVQELDGLPDSAIQDHVGDYVAAYEMDELFSEYIQVVVPSRLTEYAATRDPPMVVHYVQPHTPFISPAVGLKVSHGIDDHVALDVSTDPDNPMPIYKLWENGHVSTELLRAAYRQNLALAWQESERVREEFDRVITTADHGELLGPDEFGHPHEQKDQLRVVPFHATWDPPRPDPAEFGAAHSHDWVYDSFTGSGEVSTDPDGEQTVQTDRTVEDQLGDLGYR